MWQLYFACCHIIPRHDKYAVATVARKLPPGAAPVIRKVGAVIYSARSVGLLLLLLLSRTQSARWWISLLMAGTWLSSSACVHGREGESLNRGDCEIELQIIICDWILGLNWIVVDENTHSHTWRRLTNHPRTLGGTHRAYNLWCFGGNGIIRRVVHLLLWLFLCCFAFWLFLCAFVLVFWHSFRMRHEKE